MADGIDVKVSGIADFRAAVQALTGSLRKQVVRAALRDGARVIQRGAQARAPVLGRAKRGRLPGVLKRSIRVFSSKQKSGRNGVLGVYIAVRGRDRKIRVAGQRGLESPYDPFYWWWQEFGYTATGRGKLRGGTRRRADARTRAIRSGHARRITGKRFLQDAFTGHSPEALRIFETRIAERITQANARL